MKILFFTPNFLPKIGGLENLVSMLADEFSRRDVEVKLITYTDNDQPETFNYPIYRNPSWIEFLRLVKWCDVFFQHNISLKGLWPLLLFRRKYVVAHHTQHYYTDGSITIPGKIKQAISNHALNICCSKYIGNLLPGNTLVIPNCFDDKLFRNLNQERTTELIFVGRLVSDKGCYLILEALRLLKLKGITPKFSIVGQGPEEEDLKNKVLDYKLDNQVTFHGSKVGDELANLINKHQIMIVPSIWEEPFGIVVLEGLACGCKLIIAESGGLPEALGGFGSSFEKGNIDDLSRKIIRELDVLDNPWIDEIGLRNYLQQHSPSNIANQYLSVFKNLNLKFND